MARKFKGDVMRSFGRLSWKFDDEGNEFRGVAGGSEGSRCVTKGPKRFQAVFGSI